MNRPIAKRLAVLTLGLAGAFLIPANGKADYYPWVGGYYTGYYPSYSVGYSPNYWGGYYGGPYTAGYYPSSYTSYYGSSCCGGCGSACGYGCGSCGTSCGSCGGGCGSCGSGYCGSGLCGFPSACSSCGCGSSCGGGLACANGCGCGSACGSDCGGAPAGKAQPKKLQSDPDGNFEARPSPTYDETPTPRTRKKAPTSSPDAVPGASAPPGGASLDNLGNSEPAGPGFKRNSGPDDTPAAGAKSPAGDTSGFKTPTAGKSPGGAAPAEPFDARKPVGPPPSQQPSKKAPIKTVPDADLRENDRKGGMASNHGETSAVTKNLALCLQERATWSYAGTPQPVFGRIATSSPTPRRIKSQIVEWAPARVVANVARN